MSNLYKAKTLSGHPWEGMIHLHLLWGSKKKSKRGSGTTLKTGRPEAIECAQWGLLEPHCAICRDAPTMKQ